MRSQSQAHGGGQHLGPRLPKLGVRDGVGIVWDDGADAVEAGMQIENWLDRHVGAGEPIEANAIAALRDDLAAQIVGFVEQRRAASPVVRMSKGRLARLQRCERSAVAGAHGASAEPQVSMLRGVALDLFVAHQIAAGRVLEPVPALREMLDATAEWELLALLDSLDVHDAAAMFDPLASAVADTWSDIDPGWVPRTQTRATIAFADGAVVVSGVADVELGGGDTGRPGVVIEVKSGRPAPAHQAEVYQYALLCALRDGEAPAAVARWYPGAEPSPTPVSLGVLESAALRVVDGVRRWIELLDGDPPDESPGPWCAWCEDRFVCPSATAVGATAAVTADGSDEYDPDEDGSW